MSFVNCALPPHQKKNQRLSLISLCTDNLRAHPWSHECQSATCSGFDVLQELLIRQYHMPQVYAAVAALLLGKKTRHTAEGEVGDFTLVSHPLPWLC